MTARERVQCGRSGRWLVVWLWLVAWGGAGQAQTNEPPVVAATNAVLGVSMETLDDQHPLKIGDRVSYRVVEDRDDLKQLIITDAGEIEVPYLGRIKASGKTCRHLAQEIKAALEKSLYRQATVLLAVDQLVNKRGTVFLVGQVRGAGLLDLPVDEDYTLSKAIMKMGGFSDFASKRRVKLMRKTTPGSQDTKVFIVNVQEILEKGKTEKDIKLEPGDIIFVPSRLINF